MNKIQPANDGLIVEDLESPDAVKMNGIKN